jgi:hypothetical protein
MKRKICTLIASAWWNGCGLKFLDTRGWRGRCSVVTRRKGCSEDVEQLLQVIRLLALEPSEQAAAFPEFVDFVDELALLFGDQYEVVKEQSGPDKLGHAARDLLETIDKAFAKMAGHHEFFTPNATSEREEWLTIRDAARRLVVLLGLDRRHRFWIG